MDNALIDRLSEPLVPLLDELLHCRRCECGRRREHEPRVLALLAACVVEEVEHEHVLLLLLLPAGSRLHEGAEVRGALARPGRGGGGLRVAVDAQLVPRDVAEFDDIWEECSRAY